MITLHKIIVGLIAVIHLYIAWFEIFAWTTRGPQVFASLPAEIFEPTVAMAANQGIYNAFLAGGLLWSLFIKDLSWHFRVARCFLLFVLIAGLLGAATISSKILVVQSIPALAGIVVGLLAARNQKN